jgi:Queuosine biosynthesis protein QueC
MRCSKCILPCTTPGISFNEKKECNFCEENYPPYFPEGDESLIKLLQANIREGTSADCLVGLSGGKDSTYALLKLKEEFNMRVEAFTYIHEGSTTFSMENAKNICKKLNIKHHIVSLDKQTHLKTFIGFFEAWLKAPSPTRAAMTCVACKHLHILGLKIAEKRNIPMIVWSSTPLEVPPFVAIKRYADNKKSKNASNAKSSILLLNEIVKSKGFLTTFIKYFKTCYYGCLAVSPESVFLKKRFPGITPVLFYQYHNWDPKLIKNYIREKIDWKIPGDKEDWHSDCLFHYFKDYMFISMMGASYYDAFLSNQIRYGLISREEALLKIEESKLANSTGLLNAVEILNLQHLKGEINSNIYFNT